jgi:hypothetical protein
MSQIFSIFKKEEPANKVPLDVEKYYVLHKNGELCVYENWESEEFNCVIHNLEGFKFTILS